MAEKWDEGTNDSPEVVYEGFSPPTPSLCSTPASFVSTEDGNLTTTATTTFIQPVIVENQAEGSHTQEESAVIDRGRLCFVCCSVVSDKNFESVRASMNHSHAPLIVLLTDVLGYKLEDNRLHSQVVCKACYHLLDIIDELQQTLAESKTDVRTKFLETIQKLRLKYPRTDKMLKPRCLRCVQMSQSSARRRGRGRGWRGRDDSGGRGRGRGKGRGRGIGGATRAEDVQDQANDNDNDVEGREGEGELAKVALPSKSHQHLSTTQDDHVAWQGRLSDELARRVWSPPDRLPPRLIQSIVQENGVDSGEFAKTIVLQNGFSDSELTGPVGLPNDRHSNKLTKFVMPQNYMHRGSKISQPVGEHDSCARGIFMENENANFDSVGEDFRNYELGRTNTNHHHVYPDFKLKKMLPTDYPCEQYMVNTNNSVASISDVCSECGLGCLECEVCQERSHQVTYLFCDVCLTCHGLFVPWGCSSSFEFVGSKCRKSDITVRTRINEGKIHVISQGTKFTKPTSKLKDQEVVDEKVDLSSLKTGKELTAGLSCTIADRSFVPLPCNKSDSNQNVSFAWDEVRNCVVSLSSPRVSKCKDEKGNRTHFQDCTTDTNKRYSDTQTLGNSETESIQVTVSGIHHNIQIGAVNEAQGSVGGSSLVCGDDISWGKKEDVSSCGRQDLFSEKSLIDYPDLSHSLSIEREGMETFLGTPSLMGEKGESEDATNFIFNQKNSSEVPSSDRIQSSRESINTPVPERDFFIPSMLATYPESSPDAEKDVKDTKTGLKLDVSDMLSCQEAIQISPETNILLHMCRDQNTSHGSQHSGVVANEAPKKVIKTPKPRIYSKYRAVGCISKDRVPIPDSWGRKTLEEVFTDISSKPSLGKRKRKLTEKARDNVEEDVKVPPRHTKVKKNQRMPLKIPETCDQEEDDSKKALPKGDGLPECRFICEYCGRKFSSSGGFRYHVESHESNAKMYSCESCVYVTRRQADLKKHSVIHTKVKHYRCEVCGMEFAVNSSYKRHLRVHRGDKPYKCSTCGRGFRNGCTMKRHMVKHTGTRNFVCEVCGASFSLRHHYTVHRKLHTGELPFKCAYCQSGFRNHSALRLHRRKNHPREESRRLQQVKLKKTIVKGEIKVTKLNPGSPTIMTSDVLERVVAATVDSTIYYECVDSSTQTQVASNLRAPSSFSQTFPAVTPSAPLSSTEIKEEDTVVLSITDLQEKDRSSESNLAHNEIEKENKPTILTIQEPLRRVHGCERQLNAPQVSDIFPGTNCHPVNISQDFLMMRGNEGSLAGGKPGRVEVEYSDSGDGSGGGGGGGDDGGGSSGSGGKMIIMLSNTQVPDPHLYFVVENGEQATS